MPLFGLPLTALVASLGLAACGNPGDDSNTLDTVETVQSAIKIGPSGHAMDFFPCATEGGTCVAQGIKYLAYGANGSFLYRTSFSFSNMPCNNSSFGGDPAVGFTKTCYFANYELGVSEGSGWSSGGAPRDIAYGANGAFNFLTMNGTFTCNNATFGDPIPGATKACYAALNDHAFAATEGGTLTGLNRTPVAYGASGTFLFTVATGSLSCTNGAFGSDPAVGITKSCYKIQQPFDADEFNNFNAGGPPNHIFLYGDGLNGNYLVKAASGTILCGNSTFGGDPDVGQTKHCYGP
jgi:hypothetical protein